MSGIGDHLERRLAMVDGSNESNKTYTAMPMILPFFKTGSRKSEGTCLSTACVVSMFSGGIGGFLTYLALDSVKNSAVTGFGVLAMSTFVGLITYGAVESASFCKRSATS